MKISITLYAEADVPDDTPVVDGQVNLYALPQEVAVRVDAALNGTLEAAKWADVIPAE